VTMYPYFAIGDNATEKVVTFLMILGHNMLTDVQIVKYVAFSELF
jgi:hypothetical protein